MIRTASYRLFGHTAIVRYDRYNSSWLPRLNNLLAGYRAAYHPASGADKTTVIYVYRASQHSPWVVDADGEVIPCQDEDTLVSVLEVRIIIACVQQSFFPLLLHAGAVVRDNSTLILPASSGSGKTTLTLALRERGWLPLTDDICPVSDHQEELVVMPCQRCCHLSPESLAILAERHIPLQGPVARLSEYYRPTSWGISAPVRWIIAPTYQAGASLSLKPLTQAEGAAKVIEASFSRRSRTKRSNWPLAIKLACQAPAFLLTYSSLDEAFDLIERMAKREI